MNVRIGPLSVSYSESLGSKLVYAVQGYREKGVLVGFNTPWGGRCAWVRVG